MTTAGSIAVVRRGTMHPLAAFLLVAAVYTYFLLFAQFGFLQGIRQIGLSERGMPLVLGAMALAGVTASLAAPRMIAVFGRGGTMSLGLLICAGAAASAGYAITSEVRSLGHVLIAAIGVGAGLGLATVGLAADLRRLTRAHRPGLLAGCGTGLAYFVCSIPVVHGAVPTTKAWFVAVLAALAVVPVALSRGTAGQQHPDSANRIPPGWRGPVGLAGAVAAFFALVWFDSAAFAALQLAPEVHARHWGRESQYWVYACTHAVAALAAGALVDRGWIRGVLAGSFLAIVAGAWAFAADGPLGSMAMPVYVAGVSSYSAALAAFAALADDGPGRNTAAWRAAWIYAIAGWLGSSAGIGVAEGFGHLPTWTMPVAAVLIVAALAFRVPRGG